MPSHQELAYMEAIRGSAQQQGVLDNVRARAGAVFAAASASTAFIAPQALAGHVGFPGVAWAAAVAFAVAGTCSLLVLWPYQFHFSMNPVAILEGWAGYDDDERYAHLARYLDKNWAKNSGKLSWLLVLLQVGIIATVAEIILWFVLLAR